MCASVYIYIYIYNLSLFCNKASLSSDGKGSRKSDPQKSLSCMSLLLVANGSYY